MRGIETRQIKTEDVPQIIAIQQAIIKKKVSRRWVQMVENHLRRQDAVDLLRPVTTKSLDSSSARSRAKGLVWSRAVGSRWLKFTRARWCRNGHALSHRLFQYFKKRGVRDVYTAVRWDAVDMLSFFKSIGFDRSEFINLIRHLD